MWHEFSYYAPGRVAVLCGESWWEYVGPGEVGRLLCEDDGVRGWRLAARLTRV